MYLIFDFVDPFCPDLNEYKINQEMRKKLEMQRQEAEAEIQDWRDRKAFNDFLRQQGLLPSY